MPSKAVLTVNEPGFFTYDEFGNKSGIDIFGYVTLTPGYLFERIGPGLWRSQNTLHEDRTFTLDALVSKEDIFSGKPVTYALEIQGLHYSAHYKGADYDIATLTIPTASRFGHEPMQIGLTVAEAVNAAGLIVNGSSGGDWFTPDVAENLDTAIDWNLGGGDNYLLSNNEGIDVVTAGDGDDHVETLGGNDIIHSGGGADVGWTGDGDDWFYAGEGNDGENTAWGIELGEGEDHFFGEGGRDYVDGGGGDDVLDGGTGNDSMLGGLGNDIFIVDNSNDEVWEDADQGDLDWVKTSVSFDLVDDYTHVEKFSTVDENGTAAINLYGNRLAQEITGNAGKNLISDGGKGAADVLKGLGGDDTYRVYNAGTVVVEGAGQGLKDTVQAAISYTLKAGVEVEALATTSAAGKGALNLYGNEFGQTITGNAGANALRGYAGDDTINGGAGDDRISGGLGNDTLAGNTGADTYYFSYALNEATNVDTIKGFSGIDLISLSSAIFTKAGPIGNLAASAFVANADGKATSADHRIVYETDTGILRYDPDGTGAAAAVKFAIMDGLPTMNAGDFVIA